MDVLVNFYYLRVKNGKQELYTVDVRYRDAVREKLGIPADEPAESSHRELL